MNPANIKESSSEPSLLASKLSAVASRTGTSSSGPFDVLFEFEGAVQPISVSRDRLVPAVEKQLAKLGTSRI